jgi:hypothetical protein
MLRFEAIPYRDLFTMDGLLRSRYVHATKNLLLQRRHSFVTITQTTISLVPIRTRHVASLDDTLQTPSGHPTNPHSKASLNVFFPDGPNI